MNKADLIDKNRALEKQIVLLQKQNKLLENSANDFKVLLDNVQHQYDHLAKLVYGYKSERFISAIPPEQLSVFATEPEDKKEPACPLVLQNKEKGIHNYYYHM